MNFSLYDLLFLFAIYAVLGWCLEVAFCTVTTGTFSNRGFLNGPLCPIYGFGALIVILCLTPLRESAFLLFLGGMILTTVLELVTGIVLEKVFHQKWWDYAEFPFNLGGYICLQFSLAWGLACLFAMEFVQPSVMWVVRIIPVKVGIVILCAYYLVLLIDVIVSTAQVLKLQRYVRGLQEVTAKLHEFSDDIGEGISGVVTGAMEKTEDWSAKGAELRSAAEEKIAETYGDVTETLEKYRAMVEEFGQKSANNRILKAFPQLKANLTPKDRGEK